MKILLIGGTGFIGPHVARQLLRQGHSVMVYHRGFSRNRLPEFIEHIFGGREELANHEEEFRRAAPDVVVDFIISSGSQAQTLMETFRGIAKRVVLLSSGDVYRACGILHGSESGSLQPLPLNEESELRSGSNSYRPELRQKMKAIFPWLDGDYDKIPAERAVLNDAQISGTVLRLPMVYGPGDPLHRLFAYLKRMDDGRAAILIQEDAAHWRGPRGYVENVAAAIALASVSEQAAGHIYNVAELNAFSEIEWAEKIGRAAGWKGVIIPVAKEHTPPHLRVPYNSAQHWVYSTEKIRQLGYRELIDEDTGLERTIAWERENPPTEVDLAQFDYQAEDKVLQRESY